MLAPRQGHHIGAMVNMRNGQLVGVPVFMGGNPKIGVLYPKWMVKIMENPLKMDDLGGKPTIFGNILMAI